MLILGDESGRDGHKIPWVTWSLIAINAVVFLMELSLGEAFIHGYSMVPREIIEGRDLTEKEYITRKQEVVIRDPVTRQGRVVAQEQRLAIPQYPGPTPIYLTLITSMFMHGGWIHLIGNMMFLFIFGDNVERAFGHGLFVFVYVLCGLAADGLHIATGPDSIIPTLGASGAISGVLGAYICMFPFNKVKVWMGWYWGVVELPAIAVLGFWIVQQFLSGIASITPHEHAGGVAYWAHIGGFGAGLIFAGVAQLVFALKDTRADRVFPDDAYRRDPRY